MKSDKFTTVLELCGVMFTTERYSAVIVSYVALPPARELPLAPYLAFHAPSELALPSESYPNSVMPNSGHAITHYGVQTYGIMDDYGAYVATHGYLFGQWHSFY